MHKLFIFLMTSLISGVTAAPVDPHVTPETLKLYNILKDIAHDESKVMVGKMSPTLTGTHFGHPPYELRLNMDGQMAGWEYTSEMARENYTDELCDPCALTHDFPAVTGFEMRMIGTSQEDAMTYLMHAAHERGAIITMSFHMPNLATGNGTDHVWWDHGNISHSVKRILPGGDHHHQFLSNLDAVAAWSEARVDNRGRLIPIIFRLWHEANGDWFWWGLNNAANNTVDDIKQLFRLTVTYLRDTKRVHNFLYAFAPDGCSGIDAYMDLYPGDDVVDVMGIDCYLKPDMHGPVLKQALDKIVLEAEARGKIANLAETGQKPANGLFNRTHYFTQELLYPFLANATTSNNNNNNITTTSGDDNRSARVAYLLTWKNECWGNTGTGSEYDPYPGHPAAADYMNFYNDPHTLFLSDLKTQYPTLYQ